MTARMPDGSPLVGRFVELQRMTRADLPELFAAIGRPEVFADGYGGGPVGYRADLGGFLEFAERYYEWEHGLPYVVRRANGEVIGTSTLGHPDLPAEQIEIGWTAYTPAVWGGPVNPESKLLLLDTVFAHGFGRVTIQADAINDRSRAAIRKLGATFEGIRRRDRRRADGSWRDTAVHSILTDEWPAVRERLEDRLTAF